MRTIKIEHLIIVRPQRKIGHNARKQLWNESRHIMKRHSLQKHCLTPSTLKNNQKKKTKAIVSLFHLACNREAAANKTAAFLFPRFPLPPSTIAARFFLLKKNDQAIFFFYMRDGDVVLTHLPAHCKVASFQCSCSTTQRQISGAKYTFNNKNQTKEKNDVRQKHSAASARKIHFPHFAAHFGEKLAHVQGRLHSRKKQRHVRNMPFQQELVSALEFHLFFFCFRTHKKASSSIKYTNLGGCSKSRSAIVARARINRFWAACKFLFVFVRTALSRGV
jgi:hypothetical protein